MSYTHALSKDRVPFSKNYWLQFFCTFFFALFLYTYICTPDRANWWLENLLTFVTIGIMVPNYRRFQFSDLSYTLVFVFLCLHVYGAMYTYAENTFGYWLQDLFQTERNQYDRIVHFGFGFLLAYPMREIFLIGMHYPKKLAWIIPIETALAFGGLYEIIEWLVADLFFIEQGTAYLGTQGDPWDAQKDIMLAFVGAIMATTVVTTVKKIYKITHHI